MYIYICISGDTILQQGCSIAKTHPHSCPPASPYPLPKPQAPSRIHILSNIFTGHYLHNIYRCLTTSPFSYNQSRSCFFGSERQRRSLWRLGGAVERQQRQQPRLGAAAATERMERRPPYHSPGADARLTGCGHLLLFNTKRDGRRRIKGCQ